jgi:hypothetical protein
MMLDFGPFPKMEKGKTEEMEASDPTDRGRLIVLPSTRTQLGLLHGLLYNSFSACDIGSVPGAPVESC